TPAAPWLANTSFVVTVSGAKDLSGNIQSAPIGSTFVSVDTIAPVVQLLSPPDGSVVNSGRPTISFNATDNLSGVNLTTASISIDGQQVATGALSFTPPTSLSDGHHTVSASVADRAGNLGTACTNCSFTVDTQPPSQAMISGVIEDQVLSG